MQHRRPVRLALTCAAGVAAAAACGGDLLGPLTRLPRPLSVAETRLIEADNAFAFELFREITARESPGANVFISPLSVGMALGMAYNGAAGSTREAMRETLELHALSLEDVNAAYRGVIDLLRGLDPRVELTIANAVWHDVAFTPRAAFLEAIRAHFDAEIAGLDFARADAPGIINEWVREATRGKIPTIIDAIPNDVVAYLINAIYFKGAWTHRFDQQRTAAGPFRLADGSATTAQMMTYEVEHPIRIHFDGAVEIVDLPYSRGAYSMTIALPATPEGIHALAQELTPKRWNAWIAGLDSTRRFVSLPRFTVDYDLTLNDALTSLGMGEAFCPDLRADFGNMFADAAPGQFCISRVLHKTFVDVNEEGTEAAAATAVEVSVTSLPPTTVVDRPFVFVIRERLSGTILFMGRIMDPNAG